MSLLAYPCRQRLLDSHALDFIGPYGRPLQHRPRQVDHDNLSAEGCQPGRQGQTDSRGGAGDDRNPIAPLLVNEGRHGLSPVFGAPRRGAQPDRALRVAQPAAQPNSWTAPKLLGWRKPRIWLMRTVGVV